MSYYYYNIAAKLGYAPAKFMVALDYMGGDGVKADMTLAVKYMQEAADEGVTKAQYMYALFYSGDDNKSNDSNEAINRLNELVQSGVQGGRKRIDQMIEKIRENKYIQYRSESN